MPADTLETTTRSRADTPAIAKARLLTLALQRCAEAGVSTSAVAVLAHLIADSWPKDDGWSAETRDQTIASRLALHVNSVRRCISELVDAGIVERRAGIGRCPSRHVVRVTTSGDSESAPARTQSQRQW